MFCHVILHGVKVIDSKSAIIENGWLQKHRQPSSAEN